MFTSADSLLRERSCVGHWQRHILLAVNAGCCRDHPTLTVVGARGPWQGHRVLISTASLSVFAVTSSAAVLAIGWELLWGMGAVRGHHVGRGDLLRGGH